MAMLITSRVHHGDAKRFWNNPSLSELWMKLELVITESFESLTLQR